MPDETYYIFAGYHDPATYAQYGFDKPMVGMSGYCATVDDREQVTSWIVDNYRYEWYSIGFVGRCGELADVTSRFWGAIIRAGERKEDDRPAA